MIKVILTELKTGVEFSELFYMGLDYDEFDSIDEQRFAPYRRSSFYIGYDCMIEAMDFELAEINTQFRGIPMPLAKSLIHEDMKSKAIVGRWCGDDAKFILMNIVMT